MIDYIETRSDLDANAHWHVGRQPRRLLRAALPRFRPAHQDACIALGGPFNMGKAWDGLPELTRAKHSASGHGKTRGDGPQGRADVVSAGRRGAEHHLPDFHRRADAATASSRSRRRTPGARGRRPVELMMIDDGNHIGNNRAYRWRSQTADWMKERLASNCPADSLSCPRGGHDGNHLRPDRIDRPEVLGPCLRGDDSY